MRTPHRGGSYLRDPATGLLYHDAAPEEWPQLVGRVDPVTGRVAGLGPDAATAFFTQLDACLRNQKVRGCVQALASWIGFERVCNQKMRACAARRCVPAPAP